jgi:hypothetical protein
MWLLSDAVVSDEKLFKLCVCMYICDMCAYFGLRWAGHVACMGRGEVHTGLQWGNMREGNHLEDPGLDGRIILKWIFERLDERAWTGSIWPRKGYVMGSCQYGDEHSGSIKCGEFLE